MKELKGLAFFAAFLSFCCYFVCFCQASDTLRPGDSLTINQTLVSAGGVFELGFFGTGGPSSNHYLGIWFKNDPYKKPVWVANRNNPILDNTGILTIRYDGNLVITDTWLIPIIVNYGMLASSGNTTAKLLDSGNLILMEGKNIAWQSFYFPSDTFLPGMKLGWLDLDTDHVRLMFLVSWLSPLVPTTGAFATGLAAKNMTVLNLWRRDGLFRQIGFWDGHSFRFYFQSSTKSYYFSYVSNQKDTYLQFDTVGNNMSWFVLNSTGDINEYTWQDQSIVMVNHTLCDSASADPSDRCLIPMPSMCGKDSTFLQIRGTLPTSLVVSGSILMGPSDCEIMCRSNCSCTAYASFHDDGTGCELYFGDVKGLLGIKGKGNGTIYIRVHAPIRSDLPRKRRLVLAVIFPTSFFIFLVLISVPCYRKWRKNTATGKIEIQDAIKETASLLLFKFGTHIAAIDEGRDADGFEFASGKDPEVPLLSFSCIVTATDSFSAARKIGEGGFGPVYKGMLLGYEIAVKRLSRMSGQGLEEFKNEVQLISKLQHRNVVRLMGYCIEGEEKILVYEYMPNGSLDSFIFGPMKRKLLDWRKRVNIIEGIAQGLLYLHKYSRLKIIHRDLKTSNILLDGYMNPKISDFGMARIFDEKISLEKTRRVAGTFGYMSPEYAVHGLFSTRSDVFSFGVMMLEIVSGRRNSTFYETDGSLNLLGHAWRLWEDGQYVELMDPAMENKCCLDKLALVVQVALLCVQENAGDRPSMSDVLLMITSERTHLPLPKQPAFPTHLGMVDVDSLEGR